MFMHSLHGEPDYSFAIEEYNRRFTRARKIMEALEIDALLISQLENLYYFTGLTYYDMAWSRYMYIWPNILLIPRDGEPEAIAHHIYQGSAYECYPFKNVEIWSERDFGEEPEYVQIVQERLRKLGLAKGVIGCEMGDDSRMELGFRHFSRIKESMKEAKFVDASPLICELRMIKSDAELAFIRMACGIQDQAIARLRERIHVGMQGDTARNIFREEVSKLGGRPLWELGSHFGGMLRPRGPERGRDRQLKRGEIFNFDFGITYGSYHADYGRTWIVGTPNADQLRDYESAICAVKATVEACKPGALASEVVKICHAQIENADAQPETVISSSGFLGHGVGLNMAERPHLSLHSKAELRSGMVLALEPSIQSNYGWFNVEQMILVTDDGYELLSRAPMDFFQIPEL
jgi:Xaa-Pro aminopeptidase